MVMYAQFWDIPVLGAVKVNEGSSVQAEKYSHDSLLRRRACPSFAMAEWQLVATSTKNGIKRVRFMIDYFDSSRYKVMKLFYDIEN